MTLTYEEAAALVDRYCRVLRLERAQIDAAAATPDHTQRSDALAARLNELLERKEHVGRRLRAGAITDVDAARELAGLIANVD